MKSKMTQHKGPEINAYTNQGYEEDSGKTWVLPSGTPRLSFVSGNKCSSLSFRAPPFTHFNSAALELFSITIDKFNGIYFKRLLQSKLLNTESVRRSNWFVIPKADWSMNGSGAKKNFPVALIYGIWNILVWFFAVDCSIFEPFGLFRKPSCAETFETGAPVKNLIRGQLKFRFGL